MPFWDELSKGFEKFMKWNSEQPDLNGTINSSVIPAIDYLVEEGESREKLKCVEGTWVVIEEDTSNALYLITTTDTDFGKFCLRMQEYTNTTGCLSGYAASDIFDITFDDPGAFLGNQKDEEEEDEEEDYDEQTLLELEKDDPEAFVGESSVRKRTVSFSKNLTIDITHGEQKKAPQYLKVMSFILLTFFVNCTDVDKSVVSVTSSVLEKHGFGTDSEKKVKDFLEKYKNEVIIEKNVTQNQNRICESALELVRILRGQNWQNDTKRMEQLCNEITRAQTGILELRKCENKLE